MVLPGHRMFLFECFVQMTQRQSQTMA